jgi:hypothetical protein
LKLSGESPRIVRLDLFSTEQMIDVVFTVGQYNLVSMALRTFGVQREEGSGGFPQ